MINVNALTFDGVELHQWAPGFQSQLTGNWAEHRIPGQRGALQEDLGEGVLSTKVILQFVGPKFRDDYNQVMTNLTKHRRGELNHPVRGSKTCILYDVVESMDWTKQGNAIRVELTFKEASVNIPDHFTFGVSALAQGVLSQAAQAQSDADQYQKKMFVRFPLNTLIRSQVLLAVDKVNGFIRAATTYASVGLSVFQDGQLGLDLVNQLQSLPPLLSQAASLLSQTNSPLLIQPTLLSMEQCLYTATQLSAALRANLPPPITTLVSRSPGQSIYSFVQAWYPEKSKGEQLALIPILLQLNRDMKTPSLIPMGFRILRPAS